MKDPAGIVNLEELDRISSLSGAGDGDVIYFRRIAI